MMPKRIEPSIEQKAAEAYERAFYDSVGHLNRAQRRTAHGKQLVAEAHAKALQAKVRMLEEELSYLKAGL